MASESILLYFKARSQNLFTESSDLDKLTTNLCNGELELVYILSRRGKKRRVIKLDRVNSRVIMGYLTAAEILKKKIIPE
jgi:hypothetical protein